MLYWTLAAVELKGRKRDRYFYVKLILDIILYSILVLGLIAFWSFRENSGIITQNKSSLPDAFLSIGFVDLLIRIFFQNLTFPNVYPYLLLNVSRNKLVNYLSLFLFLNKFNGITLFVVLAIQILNINQPLFLSIILGLMYVANLHLLTVILKHLTSRSRSFQLFLSILLALIAVLSTKLSYTISIDLSPVVNLGLAFIILMIFSIVLFRWQKSFINDALNDAGNMATNLSIISLHRKFGRNEVYNWLLFEVKMILRNSRPKRILAAGIFSTINWIFIANTLEFLNEYVVIILVMAISTLVTFAYGIFSISWHCNHFDFLMLCNCNYRAFIQAKLIILSTMSFLMLLTPITLFIFTSSEFLIPTISCSLYMISFPSYITMYFAVLYARRIDTNVGGFTSNYEGRSYKHLVPELIYFTVPVAIFFTMKAIGLPAVGYRILIVLGLVGILSSKHVVELIHQLFLLNKHKMIVNLRK